MGIFISKVTSHGRFRRANKTPNPPQPKPSIAEQFGLRTCYEADVDGLVLDVVDLSDPSFLTHEVPTLLGAPTGVGYCRSDLVLYVTSTACLFERVVLEINNLSFIHGKLRLLRFHGHGAPGYQSIWGGRISEYMQGRTDLATVMKQVEDPTNRFGLGYWNLGTLTCEVMKLCRSFAPNAEVWLMGCEVGSGSYGSVFTQRLSQILGVPVQAAVPTQFGSKKLGAPDNFLHEGQLQVGAPTLNPFKK